MHDLGALLEDNRIPQRIGELDLRFPPVDLPGSQLTLPAGKHRKAQPDSDAESRVKGLWTEDGEWYSSSRPKRGSAALVQHLWQKFSQLISTRAEIDLRVYLFQKKDAVFPVGWANAIRWMALKPRGSCELPSLLPNKICLDQDHRGTHVHLEKNESPNCLSNQRQ